MGDEAILDITHSFRYVPFFSFLSIVYSNIITGTRIISVTYGAFEAYPNEETDSPRPVFNLIDFVKLVDWIVAVEELVRFGSFKKMSELVSEIDRKMVDDIKNNQSGSEIRMLRRLVGKLSGTLEKFSNSYLLAKVDELLERFRRKNKGNFSNCE